MNLSGKRSASPLPRKLDEVFRPRISHDKKDKFQSATTSLGASLVREGQEVLSLSVSLKHDLRHENVNDLILGTTIRLAQEGKRLIKAPRLLSDGIAFDWISDTTARNEDIKSLFSVEGIRVQDLEMVLLRATPMPGGYTCAATEGPSNLAQSSIPPYPNLTGVDAQGPSAAAIKGAGIGSASDPIVVDDDGESASERVSRPGGCFVSPRRSSSEALRFSRHADRSSSYGAASSQRRPLPTTDVSVPVSSHYKKSEGSPLHIRHPHRSIPQSPEPLYSHDRLSVVSYASRGAETPSSEDVIQGVRVCPSEDGDVRYDTPEYGSLRSIPFINARSKGAADSSEGRAEYGEWKHLAEDSSDVEMEAGHPSSRESSLARSIPPQKSTHAVTGLPFLPQTYDTSDLVLQQPSAPASGTTRTGASPSNSSSTSERDNSPPRRAPELPRRRIDRPSRNGEDSDGSIDGESPPVQSLSRRRPVEASKPSTGQGIYLSEDDSDINSGSKVQKPTAAHRQQRSSAGSRTLRKVQPGSSVKAALQRRRSAPDRPRRSARRSTSHASEEVNYSSLDEDDDESPASSSATLGHTLVIPKADYARGRRLLVPASLDSPITTVLMRGEAHFIDQRRKTIFDTSKMHAY
ncbi:hypothetical protein DICSQDRAFT_168644 [Dichomitus squalens LYAD-421 SS1]|uniref:uncharacterized protein n=1 Tax=Dichomitus squalens (strain LYAD-421) TaxID=732165 RepID=UPI0004411A3F|nr:uncharacterized protein DICSQDRAFT_168644 [Dichomitus squalens LYAD-421 SS1]EJF62978.1 hypothetical protein DICSQDRAFT_168644 [Dichomitus squalens LYAD-421 SS1]